MTSAPVSEDSGRPSVSVIIAVFNGAATLARALDSVRSQSLPCVELIVQDGGSKDGTCDLVRARASEIAHWESAPDGGIYSAWNRALQHAKGEWICFLGSDDAFHDRNALADMFAAASNLPSRVRVVYANVALMTEAGRVAQIIGEAWPRARAAFLAGFMVPHPGALHRRSLFEERGGFDASYRIAGDYELLLRELRDGEAHHVDRTVVDMALGGASTTPASIARSLREVQQARVAHGLTGMPPRLRRAMLAAAAGDLVYRLFGEQSFRRLADGYRALRGKPRIWTG